MVVQQLYSTSINRSVHAVVLYSVQYCTPKLGSTADTFHQLNIYSFKDDVLTSAQHGHAQSNRGNMARRTPSDECGLIIHVKS
jgi:hypothetical protein